MTREQGGRFYGPALAFLVCTLGCSTTDLYSSIGFGAVAHAPMLDGPIEFDRLARDFLHDRTVESPFGFYIYLVFADETQVTLQARAAAADAYLNALDDVVDLERAGYRPQQMAILYAPVVSPRAARRVGRTLRADDLLEAYDYEGARTLLEAINPEGKPFPAVSLIGSRNRLHRSATPDTAHVICIPLFPATDTEILERFQTLESELKSSDAFSTQVLDFAEEVFRLLGATLDSLFSN